MIHFFGLYMLIMVRLIVEIAKIRIFVTVN